MHGKDMDHTGHSNMHYKHLAIMTILSFISMYILMYAMVDRFENVYNSFNQVYMAALMTAPMVFIEMLVMKMMVLSENQVNNPYRILYVSRGKS